MNLTKPYIRNRSVGIYLVVEEDYTYVGSGICIEIDNRLFISTAAHNFEGRTDYNLKVFSANSSSDTPLKIIAANYRQNRRHNEEDIAWLEIDPVSASSSNLSGVPLNMLVPYPVLDAALSTTYVISGLPRDMKQEKTTDNHTNITIPLVLYGTGPSSHCDLSEGDILLTYTPEAVSEQEMMGGQGPTLPAWPGGMSGGGIWLVPDNPILLSGEYLRLIGIVRDYQRIYKEVGAVRMHHWLQLLYYDIPELRPTLQPLLDRT